MDAAAGVGHDHQGFDGVRQVIGGVAHGEELDGRPVVGAESRCHVGEVGLGDPGQVPGQNPHGQAPGPGHGDVLGSGEAGADDHLGSGLVVELGQEQGDVACIVLTVGVDLEQDVEAVGLGHPEADPHGSTDPEGEGVGDDLGTRLASFGTRVVDRTVVDDEDRAVGNGRVHLLHHQRDPRPPR